MVIRMDNLKLKHIKGSYLVIESNSNDINGKPNTLLYYHSIGECFNNKMGE